MTITDYARQAEAAVLRDRLREAETQHRLAVSIHEAMAAPVRERVSRAEDEWNATGLPANLKALHVARRDLANLGEPPVEPISIGLLKGRIARLEAA